MIPGSLLLAVVWVEMLGRNANDGTMGLTGRNVSGVNNRTRTGQSLASQGQGILRDRETDSHPPTHPNPINF